MAAQRGYIGNIDDSFEPKLALDAKAVIHDIGHLPIPLVAICRRRKYNLGHRWIHDIDALTKLDVSGELNGRILKDVVVKVVSLAKIVKHAEAAADRGLAIAEGIVGKAKTGSGLNVTAVT